MKKYLISLLFFSVATASNAQLKLNIGKGSPMRKLNMAEMAVTNLYVDSVDEIKLVEDAIRGMIKELDPHSSYSTAKETQSMNEPLNGSFEGIGVQFNMISDTLVVIQPISKGPSEKVGIVPGDRIVSVDDSIIAGVKKPKEDIMKLLRGKKGTKVRLGIVRRGVKDKLTFIVTRDKIPLNTVDASYLIRPNVGYIRLSSFGMTSANEVISAIDSLKSHGMKNLILDLQDNGGGYLDAAVNIADQFLKKGDLIVYTQGRTTPRQEFTANGKGNMLNGKVVVLINEFSASASEIVTGALQDQDCATVVGRRSFGKGLVQRPIQFEDGSMIRLTVAHYYTPSGRCIQKPYKKGDLKEYEMDLDNRYRHGEFTNIDSIHLDKSQKYYTLRKHRTVYGGGGIMPDYFVPLDTAKYTSFHRKLAAKNIILNSYLRFIDDNRKSLKKQYKTFADFKKHFVIPTSLIDQIVNEGDKQKIKPKDDKELLTTVPYMKTQLKALVARDLWSTSEYFNIMNDVSDIVQKALSLF